MIPYIVKYIVGTMIFWHRRTFYTHL